MLVTGLTAYSNLGKNKCIGNLKGITLRGASKKGKEVLDNSKHSVVVVDDLDMVQKEVDSSGYRDTMVEHLVLGGGSISVPSNIEDMGMGDMEGNMVSVGAMVNVMALTIDIVVDGFNFEGDNNSGRVKGKEDGDVI